MSRNRWLARWWMFAAHHLLHFSSSGPVARVSGVCCAAYQALETEPEARLSFRFSANGAPAQHPGAEVLDIWSNPGASPRSGTMVWYHGPAVSIVWIRTVYGHANTVEIISRRSFSPLALCARQPVTARNENMFFALAWSCCPANATKSQIRPGSPLDGWSTHEVWHVHVDCVGGIEMA
ncbi:hypothetical protein X797_010277 [Metarhizium robertsii]|uniref:Secreted protein n=2 Tax=Metarhizium robertsii TaxID=568076 RepID=E9FC71_METRA|nr:uncharacterized protein MAA_09870 [Metarhizium robertsii ARSEF 23]EFY94649.1 hypothetical protein MAA_09870 [Metarhizium robertsii ARSEF 23]EXU96602.1 hypothetical protein X797_010277 [Metarhizium robertsii]